ncbi:unnamed protein product, partial [Allacma fusca]
MLAFTQTSDGTQGSMVSQASQPLGTAAPSNYTIGGVSVMFPTKAYPSQLAMMNK